MKKFLCRVIPILLIVGILGIAFPIYVDPYNVFHTDAIRDNGIEPNKNYIKTKYILENPDKYDSFLFGDSRVGAIHTEKIDGLNCYNMSYSVGLPAEAYKNLQIFIAHGIIPKRVYLGVDEISLFVDPSIHESDPMHLGYPTTYQEKMDFLDTYLNTSMVLQSLEVSNSYEATDPDFANDLYNYGWWLDYDYETDYDFNSASFLMTWESYYHNREQAVLSEIADIKELCDENGIELVVFTNPSIFFTYEEAVSYGYLDFLYDLAGVTDYYNFSGINPVTYTIENYVDNSHYTAQIGDRLLDVMVDGASVEDGLYDHGYGWHVTAENRDEFLELMEYINKVEM